MPPASTSFRCLTAPTRSPTTDIYRAAYQTGRGGDMTDGSGGFPEGFRWGAATAAHQIEGGNWNNDWWAWEQTPGSAAQVPSGDACGSWEHWRRDVELCRELGLDHYRFSLE